MLCGASQLFVPVCEYVCGGETWACNPLYHCGATVTCLQSGADGSLLPLIARPKFSYMWVLTLIFAHRHSHKHTLISILHNEHNVTSIVCRLPYAPLLANHCRTSVQYRNGGSTQYCATAYNCLLDSLGRREWADIQCAYLLPAAALVRTRFTWLHSIGVVASIAAYTSTCWVRSGVRRHKY